MKYLFIVGMMLLVGCGAGNVIMPGGPPAMYERALTPADNLEKDEPIGGVTDNAPQTKRYKVKRANVEVEVKEVMEIPVAVDKIMEEHGGFIQDSNVVGGEKVTMTLRVPVNKLNKVSYQLAQMGTLKKSEVLTIDVTKKIFDLRGRIENLMSSRERLRRELRVESNKTIADRLQKDLDDVQKQIEQMQGLLKNVNAKAGYSVLQFKALEKQYNGLIPTLGRGLWTGIKWIFVGV